MEGLAAASAVAGILSMGTEVCKGLLRYYSSYRGAAADVAHMCRSVESLDSTLVSLKRVLGQGNVDPAAAMSVTKSIKLCESGFDRLDKKLKKVKIMSSAQDGWQEKAKKQLRRAIYPLRESTIVKLREIANEEMGHLALAMDVLHIDTSVRMKANLDTIQASVGAVADGMGTLNEKSDRMAVDLTDIQITTAKTHAGVANLVSVHSNEYILGLYRWLSPLAGQFEKRQQDTYNMTARQDGKARWLLSTPEFQDWLVGNISTLWCPGIQGSGKTVLSSIVIHHLHESRKLRPDVALAFVYFSYKESDEHNLINLFSSIVHQMLLLTGQVPSELTDLYEQHHAKGGTLASVPELVNLLRGTVKNFSKVLVVIDALDECPEKDGIRESFVSELLSLQPQVQLLVTSRVIPMIERQLEGATRVDIQASNEDIKTYLIERMGSSSRMKGYFEKDPDLRGRIVETVTSKAGGMFLQARLHLDSLIAKTNLRKLKTALESLPEGLDETYDEVVERINAQTTDESALAWRVLGWILHSARPLTVIELQHALAVEPGDTELDEDSITDEGLLTSVCAGIVTVQIEGETIGLVHFTTQRYLLKNSKKLFPKTQKDMVQSCIDYLSLEEFNSGPCDLGAAMQRRRQKYPLYWYASRFWGIHAMLQRDEDLIDAIIEFLDDRPKLSSSIQIVSIQAQEVNEIPPASPRSVSAIGVAAFFGLEAVVKQLIQRGDNVNVTDGYGLTPLHQSDHPDVSKLLLDNGANINAEDGYGRTPLHQAAWQGAVSVMEVLLARGAFLAAKNEMGNIPLHEAAQNEKSNSVRYLLEQKSDANAQNIYGITPLHLASRQGNHGLVKSLLEYGANIRATTDYGESALSMAALRGHENVIRLLLEQETAQGLQPNRQDDIVVKSLLGVQQVNDTDAQGRTVLHLVCAGGTLRYIEELLRRKADPNALDRQQRTCLHHAATAGSSKAMRCLLSAGLDPTARDLDGWTPLHWAAKGGKIGNIQLLLESGADPTVKSRAGWTPLAVATYQGLKSAVGALEAAQRSFTQKQAIPDLKKLVKTEPHGTPLTGQPWKPGRASTSRQALTSEQPSISGQLSTAPESPTLMNHPSDEFIPMLLSNVQSSIGRALIHRGIICDGCDLDVYDPRYKCMDCADFDFCFKCIKTANLSHPGHRFQCISLAKNSVTSESLNLEDRTVENAQSVESAVRSADDGSSMVSSVDGTKMDLIQDALDSLEIKSDDGSYGIFDSAHWSGDLVEHPNKIDAAGEELRTAQSDVTPLPTSKHGMQEPAEKINAQSALRLYRAAIAREAADQTLEEYRYGFTAGESGYLKDLLISERTKAQIPQTPDEQNAPVDEVGGMTGWITTNHQVVNDSTNFDHREALDAMEDNYEDRLQGLVDYHEQFFAEDRSHIRDFQFAKGVNKQGPLDTNARKIIFTLQDGNGESTAILQQNSAGSMVFMGDEGVPGVSQDPRRTTLEERKHLFPNTM